MNRLWDYDASVGGPIKPNRIWFFSSIRFWGTDRTVPLTFSQPGVSESGAVRLHQPSRELPGTVDLADQSTPQGVGVLQLDAAQSALHQHVGGAQHRAELRAERHDVGADDYAVCRSGEVDGDADQPHAGRGRLLHQPLFVRHLEPGLHRTRCDQESGHGPQHAVERRRRQHRLRVGTPERDGEVVCTSPGRTTSRRGFSISGASPERRRTSPATCSSSTRTAGRSRSPSTTRRSTG